MGPKYQIYWYVLLFKGVAKISLHIAKINDCSADEIKILREGPITIGQINELLNYNLIVEK